MMEEQGKTEEKAVCSCKGGNCGCGTKATCSCPHHKVVPAMITLTGLVFLLGALGFVSANTVSVLWPIFVVVAGVTKLKGGSCKCC